jgi:hypothetical protein
VRLVPGNDVDAAALSRNLLLTPSERVEKVVNLQRFATAGRKARAKARPTARD